MISVARLSNLPGQRCLVARAGYKTLVKEATGLQQIPSCLNFPLAAPGTGRKHSLSIRLRKDRPGIPLGLSRTSVVVEGPPSQQSSRPPVLEARGPHLRVDH